jgi:hypothetical protein
MEVFRVYLPKQRLLTTVGAALSCPSGAVLFVNEDAAVGDLGVFPELES